MIQKGVIFTLYQIISCGKHLRPVPYDQRNQADVKGLRTWLQIPDIGLDQPVLEYREILDEWMTREREGRKVNSCKEASEYDNWPDFLAPTRRGQVYTDEYETSIVE